METRLVLRKTNVEELDFVVKTEQDKDNKQFIVQWEKEKHIAAIFHEDMEHLILEDVQLEKQIGYAVIAGLKNENKSVELVRITVTEKGKGYGQEAIRLIQQWAFEEHDANRLWLDVKEHNHRAKHVYEKLGFVAEGTLRECLKVGDSYDSLTVMSILRTEYEKL